MPTRSSRTAAEKLLEAKSQVEHGEFEAWIKRNFSISPQHARRYIALAREAQEEHAGSFESLSDCMRRTSQPEHHRPRAWHDPVRQMVNRVDTATLNRTRDDLKR